MALPQEISPVNSELMDTLARSADMDWIETSPSMAYTKVLSLSPETGRWVVLFKWKKGYTAPPHKHLSSAHAFILSGKLQVRDGTLEAGDYLYEANGMVHGTTTALEDTVYLFHLRRAGVVLRRGRLYRLQELGRTAPPARKRDAKSHRRIDRHNATDRDPTNALIS